jgi:hypothetical protein
MTKFLVNISYPGAHRKGDFTYINPAVHAKWLLEQAEWLKKDTGMPICVSATGMGACDPSEHEYHEKLVQFAPIRSVGYDPNHQIGCAYGMRIGLDYAKELGLEYMFHTAEDVIHPPGTPEYLVRSLELSGCNYAGVVHSLDIPDSPLTTKFFACRVSSLDALQSVGWHECGDTIRGWAGRDKCSNIELYLGKLFGGKGLCNCFVPHAHSHNYDEWKRFFDFAVSFPKYIVPDSDSFARTIP